jgi:predicted Zn-dependent protease
LLLGKDRSINAFALPGGYVGVHLGLVARVSRRDELAAVLAHELSHITQRHIARSLGRQQAQSPLLAAAMVLGMLAATKSTQAGTAVLAGGQAVAAQTQLNFSRDMEREADRVGYVILEQAGFAPQGMVRMFHMLQQANRLQDSGDFPYLRSHPLTTERIADAQTRAGVLAQAGAQDTEDVVAQWMGVRASVGSETRPDALHERWTASVATDMQALPVRQQALRWYAAALAALALRDGPRAAQAWQRLEVLPLTGEERYFHRLLGAEIAVGPVASGFTPVQALEWVAQARGLQGGTRAVVFAQAQLDVALQRPERAVQDLQLWLAAQPLDAQAWELLAQALHKAQRALYAVYAQAQASAARLDYASAVQKLQAAQELARQPGAQVPHQEASMVDARLRQLQALAREQSIER